VTHARGQQGSVTAELAVALPVVVLVVATVATAGSVARATVSCHDAAWTAARLLARDESGGVALAAAARVAPPDATVVPSVSASEVAVDVAADVPIGPGGAAVTVTCRSTAPLERSEGTG
jgi:Flp pilus assembly protein TadG